MCRGRRGFESRSEPLCLEGHMNQVKYIVLTLSDEELELVRNACQQTYGHGHFGRMTGTFNRLREKLEAPPLALDELISDPGMFP